MTHTVKSLAVAGAVAAAFAAHATSPAHPQSAKKCFSVSLAGQNQCAPGPGTTCTSSSAVDYLGNTWTLVHDGTCKSAMPTLADGDPGDLPKAGMGSP
jgi:Predicted integral membrane protein